MYAIVEIKGQQFKAEAGKFVYVHYLGEEVKAGDSVEFTNVLLVDAEGEVKVGAPLVEGAKVVCTAEKNGKAKKLVVFKFHPKKKYRKTQGHRQPYTKLVVKKIVG